jgi:hypothetical protein
MALTPPSAEVCFICLDEGTAESSVELLTFALYRDIPCSCQVSCHMQCWTAYYVKKGGFECPICHSKVVTLPLPASPPPASPRERLQMVVVVRPRPYDSQGRGTFYIFALIATVVVIILILRAM